MRFSVTTLRYLAELVLRNAAERVVEPMVEVEARAASDRGRAEGQLAVDEQVWSMDLGAIGRIRRSTRVAPNLVVALVTAKDEA